MIKHILNGKPLALSAWVAGSVPPVTVTLAGHTAETNVDRIARELLGAPQPSPQGGVVARILSAARALVARLAGRPRQVDRCIHLWYTLPENSLNGQAQMRRLFIAFPDVSWGPLLQVTDRPDVDATVAQLVAAWRA